MKSWDTHSDAHEIEPNCAAADRRWRRRIVHLELIVGRREVRLQRTHSTHAHQLRRVGYIISLV